jgi:eukaryotic translation initiation factor 2C
MKQAATLQGGMSGLSFMNNFPTRPAYGTQGKPVVLWANYFVLNPSNNLVLHRYHVSVTPEAKGRKLKRVFELLLQEATLTGSVTDYKSLLICRNKIEDMEIDVAYRSEFEDDPQPNTRPYRVKIQNTGQLDVSELLEHIGSTQANTNFRPERQLQIVQALNVLLAHYPQSSPTMTTIASNKHFSFGVRHVEFDLGAGLSALRGYFRSVRLGTARMLVNVNVSHAVFYKPGPLVDLINAFANAYGRNVYQLEKFLKKVRVETTHLPVKKNKAGERIPRVKTIFALATTNDGFSLPHPPQIGKFAASPKEVKFWLDSPDQTPKSRAKKAKDSTKSPTGYISVYDFFKTSTQCP